MQPTDRTSWRWRASVLSVIATLALVAGNALAQPRALEGLLPPTTVAAFYLAPTEGDLSVLTDVWNAAGGEQASETFLRVIELFGADLADLDGAELDPLGLLVDELAWACPAIGERYDADRVAGLAGESVLALSISPFNPFPGAIALARPSDTSYAAALQDALIECFAEGPTFDEGGVTLHVLGDGSDLPLVVARWDDTFAAATDPDLLRGAVRLARGSDEPSHLDTATGRNASAIMDGGIGLSVDFAALAAGIRPLVGTAATGPDAAAAERLLSSLASLGGGAARLTIDADGLRFDGFLAPDPSAGDATLARLLACSDCSVGAPPLLPAGAVSISSAYVDVVGAVAWLDEVFADLSAIYGESIDVRGLAAEGGLDLDALLLDWIGTDWHAVQLAPLGTDLTGWLVSPPTLLSVSARDEAATRAALANWRALLEGDPAVGMLLEDLLYELAFMVDPFGPGPSGLPLGDGGLLVVREQSYRGVDYERWRVGMFLDVGLMVRDGQLIGAVPASAMRAAIDAHLDGNASGASDPLAARAADAVGRVTTFGVSDTARHLEGLAALSDLGAAPLATLLSLAIQDALSDPWSSGWDDWDDWDDWGGWDEGGVSGLWRQPTRYGSTLLSDVARVDSFSVPGFVRDSITSNDLLPNGDYGLVFELVGVTPAATITIEMLDPNRSWDMDTYLYLYDVDAGVVIADNDDAPDTNRSELVFVAEAGVRYAVIASSWGGNDVGDITLEAFTSDMDAAWDDEEAWDDEAWEDDASYDDPMVDAPSFAELVQMFDAVTDTLLALSERVGLEVGSTVVEDGVRRTTWSLPLR